MEYKPDDYDIPENPEPPNYDNIEPEDHIFRNNAGQQALKKIIIKKSKKSTAIPPMSEKTEKSNPDNSGEIKKPKFGKSKNKSQKNSDNGLKSKKQEMKKLTVDVSPNIIMVLKIFALKKEMTLSGLVNSIFEEYLKTASKD